MKFENLKVYSGKPGAPFYHYEDQMFCWGRITAIHHFGEYEIIEYLEMKRIPFGDNSGVNISSTEVSNTTYFHINGTSNSAPTLEMAIIEAIAMKYDGLNTQAHVYFARAIQLPGIQDY